MPKYYADWGELEGTNRANFSPLPALEEGENHDADADGKAALRVEKDGYLARAAAHATRFNVPVYVAIEPFEEDEAELYLAVYDPRNPFLQILTNAIDGNPVGKE